LPRPNKKKIGELKMEGCEVLVTMMTDAEGANIFKQGCELSMLEWVHLPMPAKSLPSPMDKDFFKTRVAELAKMLNDGQKIVFHCDDGITRSAVIVYAVLRSLGHEPTKAEELIVKARAPAAKGLTFTARQWADEVAGVSK
jgi:protein-tyrosine phosphatase